jgi:hypothetical protein
MAAVIITPMTLALLLTFMNFLSLAKQALLNGSSSD